jgi:hypothetical protein
MKGRPMRKTIVVKLALPVLVAVGLNATTTESYASFSPIGVGRTNYVQNFNSLASSGHSMTLPAGWSYANVGKNADNQNYLADNGTDNNGGTYSYGQQGSNNRAFGVLTDATGLTGIIGAEFQNQSGGSLNRLNISYTGEEWRLGKAGVQNLLQFQYSLNANGVNDSHATWINAPSLSFSTPNTSGVGAHDGTLAINQHQVAGSISFMNIPNNGYIWIRWQEVMTTQKGSPGDGLAIDNFSISAVPEASTNLAAFGALGLIGMTFWKRRYSLGLNRA